MYESLKFRVEGRSPLLMHNGLLADPMNPIVREMKKITSKSAKKKTDADLEELGRLEFLGGLYLNEEGHPCIPGDNLAGWIRDGGRATRNGKDVEAGVFCEEDSFPLIYDGPKNPEKLWEDKRYVDRRGVVVARARVIRTRPIFRLWALEAEVMFDPGVVNERSLREWVQTAGQKGLCDFRPRFGRGAVEFI